MGRSYKVEKGKDGKPYLKTMFGHRTIAAFKRKETGLFIFAWSGFLAFLGVILALFYLMYKFTWELIIS